LKVIDAVLKVETPFGPAWRRYNHDAMAREKMEVHTRELASGVPGRY